MKNRFFVSYHGGVYLAASEFDEKKYAIGFVKSPIFKQMQNKLRYVYDRKLKKKILGSEKYDPKDELYSIMVNISVTKAA